jgi:hypothetical protein
VYESLARQLTRETEGLMGCGEGRETHRASASERERDQVKKERGDRRVRSRRNKCEKRERARW